MLEFLFKLSPPSAFGLPGDDYTVLPGGEGGVREVQSDAIDSVTNNVVNYGTFSIYRTGAHKVNFSFDTPEGLSATVYDNFVRIVGEGEQDELTTQACRTAENLSLWMSHHLNAVIGPELIQIVNPEIRRRIPSMRIRRLMKVRYYHGPTIREGLARFSTGDWNEHLEAALRYYRLGMFLQEHGQEHTEDFQHQLLNEAVLNYYKSTSAIIGDPSIDKDYQRCYRVFGITDDYYRNEIEWLRRDIRNNGGVAHYILHSMPAHELIGVTSRARDIAKNVITAATTGQVSQ